MLAGKINLPDLKHTHIEVIQDYVAQVGMGPIENRATERLAKSDATTIMLRRIWMRELQALADGKPIKNWAFTAAIQEPIPMI